MEPSYKLHRKKKFGTRISKCPFIIPIVCAVKHLTLLLETLAFNSTNSFTIVCHNNNYISKQKHDANQLLVHMLRHCVRSVQDRYSEWNCTNITVYVRVCACGVQYVCTWVCRKPFVSVRVKETHVETVPAPQPTLAIWWSLAHNLGLPLSPSTSRQNSDQSLWAQKQRDVFARLRV